MTNKETLKDKNILIAYHANCIDGFTAAWVTARALEDMGATSKLLEAKYGGEGEDDVQDMLINERFHELYIVDFSVSLEFIDWLNYKRMPTTILDHHKSAFERYFPAMAFHDLIDAKKTEEYVNIILDNKECGASLCWKYFYGFNSIPPNLINYVKDYDLWQFKFGDSTKHINKILKNADKDLGVWAHICEKLEDTLGHAEYLTEGKYLQDQHDELVQAAVNNAVICRLGEHGGLAAYCDREQASDVGNKLAELSGTFGVAYSIDKYTGEVFWSIRSKGDYDVSAIANKYGGGGHKNAAGFKTNFLIHTVYSGEVDSYE